MTTQDGGDDVETAPVSQMEYDSLGNAVPQAKIPGNGPMGAVGVADTAKYQSLADLPVEILIQIFSHLDPFDLDNRVGAVCKSWNRIINNNELWKETFKQRFGTSKFASLSRSKVWRDEYVLRVSLLRKWAKGTSVHKNYPLENTFPGSAPIRVAADFANDRYVAMNPYDGVLNIGKLSNGRNQIALPVLSRVIDQGYRLTPSFVVFFAPGNVLAAKFLNSKSYLNPIVQFKDTSVDNVELMALDCVDNMSGKDGSCGCITGDAAGRIKLWDLKAAALLETIQIPNYSGPIFKIWSNFKDAIVALGENFEIHVVKKNMVQLAVSEHEFARFAIPPHGIDTVDFPARQIVCYDGSTVHVYSFADVSLGALKSYRIQEAVDSCIVELSFDQNIGRDSNHALAGDDVCMMAAVLDTGAVYVFNIRSGQLSPTSVMRPDFKKRHTDVFPVRTVAINSAVAVIGTVNGVCFLYDVLTGRPIRVASVRIPRRLLPMEYDSAVDSIVLNPDSFMTNGVIVTKNLVQYFQFGDLGSDKDKLKKKRRGYNGSDRKNALDRGIKAQLEDMAHEQDLAEARNRLIEKYNGRDDLDESEELQLAMALSESLKHGQDAGRDAGPVDAELQKILELSKIEASGAWLEEGVSKSQLKQRDDGGGVVADSEDAALVAALERSKVETRAYAVPAAVDGPGEGSTSTQGGGRQPQHQHQRQDSYELELARAMAASMEIQ